MLGRREELQKIIEDAQKELVAIYDNEFEHARSIANMELATLADSIKAQIQMAVNLANNHNLTFEIEDIENSNMYLHHDGATDWDSSSAYC